MSVAPETLDTALCEWCAESTPATSTVSGWDGQLFSLRANLCNTHAQEAASDYIGVNLYPVTYPKPEYTTLETEASPMTGEWTIHQLELAAKYGAPYPVCGDLTTKKRIGKSWVGHDPSGEQY